MAKFYTDIEDNRILSEFVKDGYYSLEIRKPRSAEHHRCFWSMMEFFSIHSPEYLYIENKDDAHDFFCSRFGKKVFDENGNLVWLKPLSVKYANMDQIEFSSFMGKIKSLICYELCIDGDTLDREFKEFYEQKKNNKVRKK